MTNQTSKLRYEMARDNFFHAVRDNRDIDKRLAEYKQASDCYYHVTYTDRDINFIFKSFVQGRPN